MAVSPSKLRWYWRRLCAMSPREVWLRAQKKSHQFADRRFTPPAGLVLEAGGLFPKLPAKTGVPAELAAALAADAEAILAGRCQVETGAAPPSASHGVDRTAAHGCCRWW